MSGVPACPRPAVLPGPAERRLQRRITQGAAAPGPGGTEQLLLGRHLGQALLDGPASEVAERTRLSPLKLKLICASVLLSPGRSRSVLAPLNLPVSATKSAQLR